MLYIRELLPDNRCSVTDTDDNITEVVNIDKLQGYIDRGLNIQGVVTQAGNIVSASPYYSISRAKLAKLIALKSIDMRVENGVLSFFRLTKPLDTDFNIRLSDYCKSISDYALSYIHITTEMRKNLTIVVDDKVSFTPASFDDVLDSLVVKLDLSGVADDTKVLGVYSSISNSRLIHSFTFGLPIVIDRKPRYLELLGRRLLSFTTYSYGTLRSDLHNIFTAEELDYISSFLLKNYKDTFTDLCNCEIELDRKSAYSESNFSRYFQRKEIIDRSDYYQLYSFLADFSLLQKNVLLMFYNYIYYYNNDRDLFDMWIEFMDKAYNWVHSLK